MLVVRIRRLAHRDVYDRNQAEAALSLLPPAAPLAARDSTAAGNALTCEVDRFPDGRKATPERRAEGRR
jgi:hypothetical protein